MIDPISDWYEDPVGWLVQRGGSACFPLAALNYAKAISLPIDVDVGDLIDVSKARHGGAIERDRVWARLGLLMKEVNGEECLRHGGVLSIMHPIFNLHACAVVPDAEGDLVVVNSWLGPTEAVLGASELRPFLPKAPNDRSWVPG